MGDADNGGKAERTTVNTVEWHWPGSRQQQCLTMAAQHRSLQSLLSEAPMPSVRLQTLSTGKHLSPSCQELLPVPVRALPPLFLFLLNTHMPRGPPRQGLQT